MGNFGGLFCVCTAFVWLFLSWFFCLNWFDCWVCLRLLGMWVWIADWFVLLGLRVGFCGFAGLCLRDF